MVPLYSGEGAQVMVYTSPTGMASFLVGLLITLKPGVWARATPARAKAAARVKRILIDPVLGFCIKKYVRVRNDLDRTKDWDEGSPDGRKGE